ncbi:MAG: DNRLRE domain-containing protein [Armatimonadetes bacterium]|nr:DNRLRE domain-containing protein [Armatimonadota bacterium]
MKSLLPAIRLAAFVVSAIAVESLFSAVSAAELPILHLRKASSPLPVVAKLQSPDEASAWYPSSPTWFGLGGKTGGRNHTEVLATYDNTALYVAFMNIDRSTVLYPKSASIGLTLVDSNAIWIETPEGRRFYLLAALDAYYPPGPRQASGDLPAFDPKADKLPGWTHSGWYAGDKTIQQTIRIPWSALSTSAPAAGAEWRVNFVNYNQTSDSLSSTTVNRQTWAPGDETQPQQWGLLAFDEAAYSPPTGLSPEAVLTLRPATGFGEEVTVKAGNSADQTNEWAQEAITQSNWNDWDPIDYTIKEFLQFDLSLIPRDRVIVSATLQNHFRGHFETSPTDLYLHVIRLAGNYDPKTATMLTSPLPVENGFRQLVRASEVGSWIDFDVTDVVAKAFTSGSTKVSFALSGSSGDIHNGKIWNVSFGRADYYDKYRPKLVITFADRSRRFSAPIQVGSLNYTSVATVSDKNKLTNGTFRYGAVEGITNTTYWHAAPGAIYVDGQNVLLMRMEGDINPKTGDPALRFMVPVNWKWIRQIATGLVGGKTYTFNGWYKGSSQGIKSDVRIEFQDAGGNALGSGQAVYSGSGNWEQVKLTKTAPAGTVKAEVSLVNWTSAPGAYMLYSNLQLEEGSTATAYSETMGVYYPDHPRTDGMVVATGGNCIGINKKSGVGSGVALIDRVVTGSFLGCFYIQCPEEGHVACGIKVVSTSAPPAGSLVSLSGMLGLDANDELVINPGSVTVAADVPQEAVQTVFGRSNRQVGGRTDGGILGPDGGIGPNTVGVVQTTWGWVSGLIPNITMTVRDGSGAPVKVVGPTGPAAEGSYVAVTGISSIKKSGDSYLPVIRTRTAGDVRVLISSTG